MIDRSGEANESGTSFGRPAHSGRNPAEPNKNRANIATPAKSTGARVGDWDSHSRNTGEHNRTSGNGSREDWNKAGRDVGTVVSPERNIQLKDAVRQVVASFKSPASNEMLLARANQLCISDLDRVDAELATTEARLLKTLGQIQSSAETGEHQPQAYETAEEQTKKYWVLSKEIHELRRQIKRIQAPTNIFSKLFGNSENLKELLDLRDQKIAEQRNITSNWSANLAANTELALSSEMDRETVSSETAPSAEAIKSEIRHVRHARSMIRENPQLALLGPKAVLDMATR